MEKRAANGKESKKGAAPEVKPNPKIHAKMPEPEVKVVGEPKEKKERAPCVTKAGTTYKLLMELAEDTKMPLQCKQIVGILSAAPDKSLNREDLIAKMIALPIVTRQPMERILGFYQSRLVAGNWIRIQPIVAVAKPAPEPVQEQPKNETGPAAE